jgi:hypothetical protein
LLWLSGITTVLLAATALDIIIAIRTLHMGRLPADFTPSRVGPFRKLNTFPYSPARPQARFDLIVFNPPNPSSAAATVMVIGRPVDPTGKGAPPHLAFTVAPGARERFPIDWTRYGAGSVQVISRDPVFSMLCEPSTTPEGDPSCTLGVERGATLLGLGSGQAH